MATRSTEFQIIGDDDDRPRRGHPLLRILAILILLVVAYPMYVWFVDRVEVRANELLVLIKKTGQTIPAEFGDQVVLSPEVVKAVAAKTGRTEAQVREGTKGIQYEVLREGRYFKSPIFYQREKIPTTLIPEGKFGVLIRRYGRALRAGKTVATDPFERGPVAGTLPPGRHDVNRFAYDVQLFDKIVVPEGAVGVQTVLSGPEPKDPNEYIVKRGERGVQPDVLSPGTYFDKNPFEVHVDVVDLRSQKYDMLREDAIEFPSADGFTIHLEATVEWSIYADRVPYVTVEIGDLSDVVAKVIRPYAMSLARIQGSKMTARESIGAREAFQRRLFDDLRRKCGEQGVQIKAATVRDLKPPEEIRSIIRERELADQIITKYENEIAEAHARAQLVEQEELALQQQAVGDANKDVVSLTVNAEQAAAVAVTQANQRLEVARLGLEAARKQAEAILARGQADAKVVRFDYEAKAEPLRAAVAAFGDGYAYARNTFLQKVAPAIRRVLTNTEGPFADIFREFQGAAPPAGASTPKR